MITAPAERLPVPFLPALESGIMRL